MGINLHQFQRCYSKGIKVVKDEMGLVYQSLHKNHQFKSPKEIILEADEELHIIYSCYRLISQYPEVQSVLQNIIGCIYYKENSPSNYLLSETERSDAVLGMIRSGILDIQSWNILRESTTLFKPIKWLANRQLLTHERFNKLHQNDFSMTGLRKIVCEILQQDDYEYLFEKISLTGVMPNEYCAYRNIYGIVKTSLLRAEQSQKIWDILPKLYPLSQTFLAKISKTLQQEGLLEANIDNILCSDPKQWRVLYSVLLHLRRFKLLDQTLLTQIIVIDANKFLSRFKEAISILSSIIDDDSVMDEDDWKNLGGFGDIIEDKDTRKSPYRLFTQDNLLRLVNHTQFESVITALKLLEKNYLLNQEKFDVVISSKIPLKDARTLLALRQVKIDRNYADFYIHRFLPLPVSLTDEQITPLNRQMGVSFELLYEFLLLLSVSHSVLVNMDNLSLFVNASDKRYLLFYLQVLHYRNELTQERFTQVVSSNIEEEVCYRTIVAPDQEITYKAVEPSYYSVSPASLGYHFGNRYKENTLDDNKRIKYIGDNSPEDILKNNTEKLSPDDQQKWRLWLLSKELPFQQNVAICIYMFSISPESVVYFLEKVEHCPSLFEYTQAISTLYDKKALRQNIIDLSLNDISTLNAIVKGLYSMDVLDNKNVVLMLKKSAVELKLLLDALPTLGKWDKLLQYQFEALASSTEPQLLFYLFANFHRAVVADEKDGSRKSNLISWYSVIGQLLEKAQLYDSHVEPISQKTTADTISRLVYLLDRNELLMAGNLDCFLNHRHQAKLVAILEVLHGHEILNQSTFSAAATIVFSPTLGSLLILLAQKSTITQEMCHSIYLDLQKEKFPLKEEELGQLVAEIKDKTVEIGVRDALDYLERKTSAPAKPDGLLTTFGLFNGVVESRQPSHNPTAILLS